ncbi:MAG: PAS domain S-box protein, partial [Bacteroidetes bacterium]|nr:PAS domain S-box protein [Bacteroidota bacterium]
MLVRQLHQAIMKATDEGMLFDEACRISVAAGKFRRACIGTRSEETGQIVVVASAGEDADFIPGMAAVPDWSSGEEQMVPAERVVREGRSVVCNDIRNSPTPSVWREAVLKRGFGSSIAIPIKRFGRVFGVFELYGDQNFFDAEEVSVLEDIAAGLAFVVELLERDAMRNKMEEELLKSKQSYQILSDTSPVGIFHTDAKGSTTYVNRRWCEISGMSSEDALGDGWFGAVHPEDRESLFSGWRIAVSVGSSSGSQYRMIRPDGSIVWVLGQAVPEKGFDGRIVGYIGTATDITGLKAAEKAASRSAAEQRKAQEVLARKEKWFRALIENSTDGI